MKDFSVPQQRKSLRPEIYFHVKDWMFTKLNLRGTKLLVFAYLFDCSLNQVKVDSKKVSQVVHIGHREARYQLLSLFRGNLITRGAKRQQIGSKYVYSVNVDETYKKVFNGRG